MLSELETIACHLLSNTEYSDRYKKEERRRPWKAYAILANSQCHTTFSANSWRCFPKSAPKLTTLYTFSARLVYRLHYR